MRLLLLIVWRRRDELESQTGRHPHQRVASVINQKKTPQHLQPGVGRTRGQFSLIVDALAVQQLALIVEKREGGWSMTVPSMLREVIEEESGRDRPPASDRGRLAP